MDTIRSDCLKYCIGFTTLAALGLLYAGIWSFDTSAVPGMFSSSSMKPFLWVACGLYFAGAILAAALRARSDRLASWILCLFAGVGTFEVLLNYPNPYGIIWFLLPGLFSAFLFDWKEMSLFTALTVAAALFLELGHDRGAFPFPEALLPLLLVLSIPIFIQLSIYQIFSVIDWYEKKYVTANLNEQIIRDNEVKLERLVRSLDETQRYLRTANDQLIKARNEAEEAKNVKQVFVQTVSHELRTPLNLIIGFSEAMIHTPGNYGEVNWTPELKGDIECIFQNSQHLKALIDDVLDLAALENQKYDIEPAIVDLNALIKEVALITEDAYHTKGLSLETNLDAGRLMVYADGVRIKQVLLNLLSNALKYTSRGGVVISARRGEQMAIASVQDTGKGIPEEAQEKVFEAFYQVDRSSNREDSGTGLGLSISKHLVELHGGEIHLTSALNKGTVVSFTLPLSESAQ